MQHKQELNQLQSKARASQGIQPSETTGDKANAPTSTKCNSLHRAVMRSPVSHPVEAASATTVLRAKLLDSDTDRHFQVSLHSDHSRQAT